MSHYPELPSTQFHYQDYTGISLLLCRSQFQHMNYYILYAEILV